jgi:hypothetical protein
MAVEFHPGVHHGPLPQCMNRPYGKQTHVPFQKLKSFPLKLVTWSDLCGPFELSVGNYRYFMTQIKLKTHLASIDFLKNKECATIAPSFRLYLPWLLFQKNANVKKIRSDNGGEYMGKEFQDIWAKSGIIQPPPHTLLNTMVSLNDIIEHSKREPSPYNMMQGSPGGFGYRLCTPSTLSGTESYTRVWGYLLMKLSGEPNPESTG